MQPCVTRRSFLLLMGGLAFLSSLSCGGSSSRRKLYPVRGKVLFDGQPAEGALVTLHALDASDLEVAPRGQVKADGSFAIATYTAGDGTPPGDYKVMLMWMPADARERIMEGKPVSNKIPALYSDPKTTPLTAQVREGPNDLPTFELSGKGKTRP